MGSNQKMVVQEMLTVITDPLTGLLTTIQKDIQAVLVEQRLWPQGRVWLKCEKPKCTNYQTFITCCIYIRNQKCDFYKEIRQHNRKCIKQQIYDARNLSKNRC